MNDGITTFLADASSFNAGRDLEPTARRTRCTDRNPCMNCQDCAPVPAACMGCGEVECCCWKGA